MSQLKLFIETLPEKGIQEKKIPLITNRNSERKQEVPAVPQEDPVFRMLLLVAHAPTPCSCPLVSILILYHLNYVPLCHGLALLLIHSLSNKLVHFLCLFSISPVHISSHNITYLSADCLHLSKTPVLLQHTRQ